MRLFVGVVLMALLLPVALAAPVQLEADSVLLLETRPTLQAGVFDFDVRFQVDADRSGYLKVLPVDRRQAGSVDNPVYLNGTVDGAGWWTEVRRDDHVVGSTNGSQLVDLGMLGAGRQAVQLRVHTPPGAVDAPIEIRLKYALAVKGNSTGGSGGNLDPSISVQPILRVHEAAQATAGQDAASGRQGMGLSIDRNWVFGVVGVAAVGLVFWLGRRSAKGGAKP